MTLQQFTGEFLTFLEQRETRLLSWGFYSVRWTPQEIEAAFPNEAPTALRSAWQPFEAEGRTLRWLLTRMLQHRLVYAVPHAGDAYRTRFAEGIRLLSNLRQMFKEGDWAIGPRLVSDLKIHLAPRTYPRRDQSAGAVWDRLRAWCPSQDEPLMASCFRALAAGRDGNVINFAGFQVRAFEHILERYGASGFSGSVICAGTGSGKTKAFYIPAFLRIATELRGEPFTKLIAIYPRNVLLADQLREAIAEAEKLRPVLTAADLRPIRFGALLGDTPNEHWFNATTPRPYHWERRSQGSVIPYLKSPVDGRSDLIWRDADRQARRTCLYREGATTPDVESGVLALTREELAMSPPDVLFLSLEMLNREMCNPRWQAAFGMRRGAGRAPRLLLLDEVHAHQGLQGAQVAWVLRRWRHWSKVAALHVTGLSATLREAPQHLARVAGLSPSQTVEFRPAPGLGEDGEMEAEGAEYNLAVKGDPAAGASLLATSIQAGMLLTRLLTPRHLAASGANADLRPEEFFRRKVFGFSDNLDSVNRWFSDMVDAESNLHLPSLRAAPSPGIPEPIRRRRMQEGQVWELPTQLGHNLNDALAISRCSSQDRGADANSDLIIATSSLEVGFDDPEVGAVLHHKRPGSMSSFIQRKGRAGRTRGARPWTVVVLSDYGADRWAFQSAERLFLPEVDALSLPVGNPYVLRVQMALFLIDWIGRKVGGGSNAFRYLQGPSTDAETRQLQGRARTLLRGLLEHGTTWKEFRDELWSFFRRFSGMGEEDATQQLDDLLWHEPRPLLATVVPILLRKLEANWQYAYPQGNATTEDVGAGRPLPRFIPKATFAELDVGEAVLELEQYNNRVREPESMAVARLLFEVCPGRVSKRFATAQGERGYWHPHSRDLNPGENMASVSQLFPRSTFLEAVDGVMVFQPDAARAEHRPSQITDASSGSWRWQTLARKQGDGEALPVREAAPWRGLFSEARAFLHSNAEWLEILRYARESRFEMRRQGQNIAGTLTLQRQTEDGVVDPEAIGFRLRLDGFRFVLPADHLASQPALSAAMIARFRTDYFSYRLRTSPTLRNVINSFQADWLAQTSLGMLTATALLRRGSLASAQEALAGERHPAAEHVLEVIFQIRGINLRGEEEESRLRKTLLDLWDDSLVRNEIVRLESLLWEPLDSDFDAWVRQRYAATLAQALQVALVSMAAQVTEDDLTADVIQRNDGGFELLVAELSPGGLGQAETIARQVQRQPRRFLDALEFSLAHCSREQGTDNLLGAAATVSKEARSGGPLSNAFAQVRQASGFAETETAKANLRGTLQIDGFTADRGLVVSIVTKLLRPGSSALSDQLIFRFNRAWRRRASRMGIGIPLRTFAYACTRHEKVGPRLEEFFARIGGEQPTPSQVYAQLQQLLLDTCRDSCPECLHQPNRYYDFGQPSRALARAWLALEIHEISIDAFPSDWVERARASLRQHGRVRVTASESRRATLAQGLPELVTTEIELEELRVPTTIARVEQSGTNSTVILHIPEFVYG